MIIIISLFPAFRTKSFHVVFHLYLSLKNVGLEIRTSWDKKKTIFAISVPTRTVFELMHKQNDGHRSMLGSEITFVNCPNSNCPVSNISRHFDEIYRKMFLFDLSSTIGKNLDFNRWKLRKYVSCAINGSKVI